MINFPLEITLRNIENSQAVETRLRKKVEKLAVLDNRIEFCRIVIEIEQNHKHKGKLFAANIELQVPGKFLVVNHQRDEDLYVAIRDAFDAMRRQLEANVQRQRGYVKAHTHPLAGKVVRVFEDYGFIETNDGQEYYFHASNVLHPVFEELSTGMVVTFIDSGAGDSLQASHISLYIEQEAQG